MHTISLFFHGSQVNPGKNRMFRKSGSGSDLAVRKGGLSGLYSYSGGLSGERLTASWWDGCGGIGYGLCSRLEGLFSGEMEGFLSSLALRVVWVADTPVLDDVESWLSSLALRVGVGRRYSGAR